MQRVVRSTLVGLLAIAGITACGDKVTVPAGVTQLPSVDSTIHSVTVSPASVTLNVGDKVTLAASVDAGPGATVRTVTWSSSNTAVATVDANSGVVTAVAAGNATIIAKANANNSVQGAAAVTVSGGGTPVNATVTISTINQTRCDPANPGFCTSVPANLGAATGQLDVTLNVDPGTQKLAGVDLLMNCNAAANFPAASDTVVATQNLSAAATSIAAEAASAPVTLSFNTAAFNSTTGASAFKNGQCILKARARTSTGTQVASTNTPITLANADVVIGSVSAGATATDTRGFLWNGGNVTVNVTPVLFTAGRTAATINVTLEGKTQTSTTAGAFSATFTDGNGANPGGATDIDNITDADVIGNGHLSVSVVDASGVSVVLPAGCGTFACSSQSVLAGNPGPVFTNLAGGNPFRLDTQKPAPGSLALANNALQGTGPNGYLGANFRFVADSAAGFIGPDHNSSTNAGTTVCAGNNGANNPVTCNLDHGGVDKVTVTFLQGTCNTCSNQSTLNVVTNTSSLSETNTATSNTLIQVTKDALGNADTAFVDGTEINTNAGTTRPAAAKFGVDKTAPTITETGAKDQQTSQAIGGTGNLTFTISDNLSGQRPQQLVAQTSLTSAINANTFAAPAENTVFTNGSENTAGPCIVGRYNATQAAAGANALPVFLNDGTPAGFCTPVPYTLAGGVNVPANIPASLGTGNREGYFKTEMIAIDQAGNQATPLLFTVAEDATNPTVTRIDLPGSMTGNSTVAISARASDNVEVMNSFAQVDYATPTNSASEIDLRYGNIASGAVAFDNVLTSPVTVSPTIPNFIKNLQVNTGAGAVTPAAAGNAGAIQVGAIDEVNRTGLSVRDTVGAGVALLSGSTSTFSTTTFTGSFAISNLSTGSVSDCPTAGCANGAAAVNPTSVTVTATATGTSGTFNNPFSAVGIWYQTPASAALNTWFFAGNTGAASARDTGNGQGVGNRFWDYVFTWTPPKTAPDGTDLTAGSVSVNLRAIGVNSNGDGMASNVNPITLTNP